MLKSSQNSKLSILQALKYQVYFTNYAHRLRHLKKRNSFFNKEVLHRYSSEILEKSAKSYNDFFELQAHEITVAQLPHLLKYEDRNSMAHSIESRLPFLDYQLVELALSLPHEHKIHGGWSKYVLRKIISPFLPNEIVWRKNKFGFNAPENLWISNYAEEMKKEINDSEILKKWIDFKDFNFESLNNRTKWRLYNFAKWEKLYNVQIEK